MSDKYETKFKSSSLFAEVGGRTEYVIDKETGEKVGEMNRLPREDIGTKIARGEWNRYENEDENKNDDDDDNDD